MAKLLKRMRADEPMTSQMLRQAADEITEMDRMLREGCEVVTRLTAERDALRAELDAIKTKAA